MKAATSRNTHLSHSQVNEFLKCPRQYHLHRRAGLPPEFCPSGLLFGSAVHEAIAGFHQGRLEGRTVSPDELLAVFRRRWESETLPVRFRPRETAESLTEKAAQMLAFYAGNAEPCGQPLAVEEPFRLTLDPAIPARPSESPAPNTSLSLRCAGGRPACQEKSANH